MHPSVFGQVMPTTARHRRALTTVQRVRIAATILLTVAVIATLGVFGGSATTQTQVLQWFSDRGVSLALVGWATYALPLLACAAIVSPYTVPLSRALGYLTLSPALIAAAIMSRPRGITSAAWESTLSSDFVSAIRLTAYALLAAAILCSIFSALTLTRPTPTSDTPADPVITLRRNVSRTLYFALASTLITLLLT